MVELLTLKQLSSIFLFKLAVAYIYAVLMMVSLDVKMNACVTASTAASPILSLVTPENISRRSSTPTKIVEDIKLSEKTVVGSVGDLLDGSGLIVDSNRVEVDSTSLGDTVGYLLAGTFFTATVAQTMYNWDSSPFYAFLSGFADRIVPKIFETEEVFSDTRRSDDYTDSFISTRLERYCLRCSRKCSAFVGDNDRNYKR